MQPPETQYVARQDGVHTAYQVDVLPAVRTPTLVLHRTGDPLPIERGREIADGIPGARFTELPGGTTRSGSARRRLWSTRSRRS